MGTEAHGSPSAFEIDVHNLDTMASAMTEEVIREEGIAIDVISPCLHGLYRQIGRRVSHLLIEWPYGRVEQRCVPDVVYLENSKA